MFNFHLNLPDCKVSFTKEYYWFLASYHLFSTGYFHYVEQKLTTRANN